VNTTEVVTGIVALGVVLGAKPVTECVLAVHDRITKGRAARSKALSAALGPIGSRAAAATTSTAGAVPVTSPVPAPADPAAAPAAQGRDPVTGTMLRADGSNKLLDHVKAAGQ
jgi:hypothetical protein